MAIRGSHEPLTLLSSLGLQPQHFPTWSLGGLGFNIRKLWLLHFSHCN